MLGVERYNSAVCLSRLFLSRPVKIVADLQCFWNLRVSAVPEEEEMKEPTQHLETLWEMYVGVSKETDTRQDRATLTLL